MVTLPLDLQDLLAQAPAEPAPTVPADTVVGHVHLKVSDVDRAASFYREVIGFEQQAALPSAAFLAAGGYHHHLGLNSWQSLGARAPAENAPGLRLIEFELGDGAALEELERRVSATADGPLSTQREPGRFSLSDPDGHRLAFVAPIG